MLFRKRLSPAPALGMRLAVQVSAPSTALPATVALGAAGVVYGDIGTSALYVEGGIPGARHGGSVEALPTAGRGTTIQITLPLPPPPETQT